MRFVIIIFTVMSFVSCSSVRYATNELDKKYIVNEKTYNIESECEEGVKKDQELRVSRAIHEYFRNQGFVEADNPELIIQFLIKEEKINYMSVECNYYGRWAYGTFCAARVDTYSEGAIVIDIIDSSSSSIVWHGNISSAPFDEIRKPDQKIKKYVNNLLKKFSYD